MFLDPDRSLYRALGLPRSVSKVRQYFFLQFVQCPIRISNLKTTCFSLWRYGESPPSTSMPENLQADDLFQSRSRRKTTLSKWVEISPLAGGWWWCKRWQFWYSEGRFWLSIFFTNNDCAKAKIYTPHKIFCHLIPPSNSHQFPEPAAFFCAIQAQTQETDQVWSK